jgi:hypothetical protein
VGRVGAVGTDQIFSLDRVATIVYVIRPMAHHVRLADAMHADPGAPRASHAWTRSGSIHGALLVGSILGCGPGTRPEADGSATDDPAGTSTGLEASASSTSTTGPEPDTTASTTDAGDGCPPRTFPSQGLALVLVDGRIDYSGPAQAECVFDGVADRPHHDYYASELQLSCTLPDETSVAVALELGVDVDPLPFAPGALLIWERAYEACCIGKADQFFLSLRDPTGELLLGVFVGFAPAGLRGAEAVLEPISLQQVEGVCMSPCDEPGDCWERGAVDVSVAGSTVVRIFDGTTGTVDGNPPFQAHVVRAWFGYFIVGAPDAWVAVVVNRLQP